MQDEFGEPMVEPDVAALGQGPSKVILPPEGSRERAQLEQGNRRGRPTPDQYVAACDVQARRTG